MPDIDIKNTNKEKVSHCGKCERLLDAICNNRLSEIETLPSICFYKADDINRYLVQCIAEGYSKSKKYIKPIITSDGRGDHYNRNYTPDNYELKDFIVSGDSDVYLVNGEAGIGKSTFLNELHFETALYSLKNGCKYLPILLRAEDFGSDNISPKNWVRKQLEEKYRYLDFEPAFFSPDIDVVFLIDAINDIQYVDYDDFKNKLDEWRRFIDTSFSNYTNIKFIISSRYLDCLSDFEIRNYTRLFIQPFNDVQIALFANHQNIDSQKQQLLLNIIEHNKDLPFLRTPFFLNKLISTTHNKVKNRTDIINTLLESIMFKGNAFIRKHKVERTINGYIFSDIKLNGTTFLDALSQIAYNNQKLNRPEITMDEIEEIVHSYAKQFIDLARYNSILSENNLKFSHPIFQEYFAGRYIFITLSANYKIDDIIFLDDDIRLSQSLKHLYNLLDDKKTLIDLLLENQKFTLAAECILEDMDPLFKDTVTSKIVSHLVQHSDSIKESETYELGLLLGKLGDPRITKGLTSNGIVEPIVVSVTSIKNLKVGIYPVTNLEYSYFINDGGYTNKEYWKDIDSLNWLDFETRIKSICEFWYKIQDKLNSDRNKFIKFCMDNKFDKELIAHLSFFKAIPKDEFELTIRDLYSEEKNMKPLMWDNPTYNNPSQPVIGVSIYESLAYCCWLNKKTKKHYRLLTNEEWEKISSASQKNYIYGNALKTSVSNTYESGLKRILPVGTCKYNVSNDGIYDLTGNIFEWTSSIYEKNETDNMFKQYICKGGSWIQDASRAKSKYIGRGMGWVRNLDLGFRVCYDEN